MTDGSHTRYSGSGKRHLGEQRSSPYPMSRSAPAIDLVDLARQIDQADQMVNARVGSSLKVIADQIKALQTEAQKILDEAQRDQSLHHAQCHFKRQPGHIYHLYQRPDGSRYFSMLTPEDWNGRPPHTFEGSYRLESDMSWTPAEDFDQTDDSEAVVRNLLSQHGL